MGEKTGVLFLIIATLVVGTLFLVINKGSTSEIGEDIRGKMSGIVNTVKGDKDDVEDKEEKGVNTGSLVLNVPYDAMGNIFGSSGSPLKEISEFLEITKDRCDFSGGDYCFDVLEFDEETGEYKSLGEEAINEIKFDTSLVDNTKDGKYPVYFTYEDKETGDIYKVATYYEVFKNYHSQDLHVSRGDNYVFIIGNFGGKNQLTFGSKRIYLEGDVPTIKELKDNGVLSNMGLSYYDKDAEKLVYLDGTEEGFEIEVSYFDRNIPGAYVMYLTYTDSDTGNVYKSVRKLDYYKGNYRGVRSDAITRK